MMKKILYITLTAATFMLSSCGKEFLDSQNLTEKNIDNYYSTPQDIEEALGGVYNALFIPKPTNEVAIVANILSDDMLAGGGTDDLFAKQMEFWDHPAEDAYLSVWETYYKGIYRANMIISKFDQVKYDNDDTKNQALGEAHFMRAFYYFRLARMFGGLPLIIDPLGDPNQARASLDDTYALIASDLKKAITIMPKTPVTALSAERNGHANVWVAESMMARVFLFYTGYANKSELPGGITKANVGTWIKDMIDNSGHALNSDPRNVWPYAEVHKKTTYPYGTKANLDWAREEGGNLETVFAIKYGAFGNWATMSHTNRLCLFHSIRGNWMQPFGMGWGWGTVNPQLWDLYDANDIRKKGYIIDVTDPDEQCGAYADGKGDHETGLFQKKYQNLQYNNADGDNVGLFYDLYGGQKNFLLWNQQDQVLIRYSDVLLMAAELGVDAQANLNKVRTRAGVASIAPTEDNIRKERRLELCFEGIRFYDMLRYGTVQQDIEAVVVPVKSYGTAETFTGKYNPTTKGLLPIPESQIRLSNGKLTQNPGW